MFCIHFSNQFTVTCCLEDDIYSSLHTTVRYWLEYASHTPVISRLRHVNWTWLIVFKHPVAFIYYLYIIYSVINATLHLKIRTFTPPHDMFRPQRAIIRCLSYAKTVALYKIYKMFIYSHMCKCDASCLIYLIYTRYLFALFNFVHFLIKF
jgi:hypothetical protein